VEEDSRDGTERSSAASHLHDLWTGRFEQKGGVLMSNWWETGNDLALIDAMDKFVRDQDKGWSGHVRTKLNSHLIGAARAVGMSEDEIRAAFASDRCLTIYEP
jgi:hypothetical protein